MLGKEPALISSLPHLEKLVNENQSAFEVGRDVLTIRVHQHSPKPSKRRTHAKEPVVHWRCLLNSLYLDVSNRNAIFRFLFSLSLQCAMFSDYRI